MASISATVGKVTAAVAGVAAIGVAAFVIPAVTGNGSGNTANLWVDANGGTCTDNASLVTYTDASACTFANAVATCDNGDLIRVKGTSQTYTDIDLTAANSRTTPCVVNTAQGESVTIGEIDITGADDLSIVGDFNVVQGAAGRSLSDQLVDITATDDLLIEGWDVDVGGDDRDGLGINRDSNRVTIRDNDIHNNVGNSAGGVQLLIIQTTNDAQPNSFITIENNRIYDNVQTAGDQHMECIWFEGVSDLVWQRNHVYECALGFIGANDGGSPNYDNWLFSQNVHEAAGGVGGQVAEFDWGGANCPSATVSATNWVFEYNYFARDTTMVAYCNSTNAYSFITYRGNIGGGGNAACGNGATWVKNLWASRDCSGGASGDTQNAAISQASSYIDFQSFDDDGPGDFRPSSGSAPQVDAGDGTNCPATDFDGNPRAVGGVCDAGPFEWQG